MVGANFFFVWCCGNEKWLYICTVETVRQLKTTTMKKYVIIDFRNGNLMDYSFNSVKIEDAEIYDDYDFAQNEIDCRCEPFCKVIEVSELPDELKKIYDLNKMGGVSLYSLKFGQKFRVLQKGWEGKTFVYQPQEFQPKGDRIFLYEKENHGGTKISISGNIAAALKVEVVD